MTPSPPHPPGSGARFAVALAVLLALTGVSYGLQFAALGAAGPVITFLIAGIKVLIVALVFMELRDSLPATRLVALFAVLFVALLCLGIAGDVALR